MLVCDMISALLFMVCLLLTSSPVVDLL